MTLNHTHDPAASSWLNTANQPHGDFPIQNLPFGVFRRRGTDEPFRGGIAIGDAVLDLAALAGLDLAKDLARHAIHAAADATLNAFLEQGPDAWRALRHTVFSLLQKGADPVIAQQVQGCLVPQVDAEHAVPLRIGDYTDFYTSLEHARNSTRLIFKDGDVSPNFRWMPLAYHGRGSTIGVSGQRFQRPWGQVLPPGHQAPEFQPCAKLDYELELALWIGTGNAMGRPIALGEAENHIFGVGLLNDWSARDIQMWEMLPLGPFNAKNFATTVSPWIVTLEALAPYRTPLNRPATDPQPLAYLEHPTNRAAGGIDIKVEVWLESEHSRRERREPSLLSRSSFKHQYWTPAQMVTHHTADGCMLQPGDLLGTGTISGPTPSEAGALIELTRGGREPVKLTTGEERAFLHDGDTVIFRGWCEKAGAARIGFGENRGTVLPAVVS